MKAGERKWLAERPGTYASFQPAPSPICPLFLLLSLALICKFLRLFRLFYDLCLLFRFVPNVQHFALNLVFLLQTTNVPGVLSGCFPLKLA
jgi:hypothetical protein